MMASVKAPLSQRLLVVAVALSLVAGWSSDARASGPPPGQADAIIQAVSPAMMKQLLGPFQPKDQLEKDILAAALLDIEGRRLLQPMQAGDQRARQRRKHIADTINAYEKQYESLRDAGTPFGYQWRVLSGQLQSAATENLIPSVRALYDAKYGARDAAGRQRMAEMQATEQAAFERAKQQREALAKARAAPTQKPPPGPPPPAADGTRFDPNNIDTTLRWWIARTREVGNAQRSGNQLRVDAAQQALRKHLAGLVGQRIRYTFGVRTPSVGGAMATGAAISAQGVHIGIQHEAESGAIRVGAERDARGVSHIESTPILLRAGRDIDASMLPKLSNRSTFVASARVVKTQVLGATFLRPPTLILFVSDVQLEQVKT
jgi:hypothetical protein